MATMDPLTGIGNRRWLEQEADRVFRDKESAPVALLLIDVDRFKWVNDTLGHRAGDELLVAISKALQAHAQMIQGGACARLGGDEFVALLPGTKSEDAQALANQLRLQVQTIPSVDKSYHPSISVGVAMAEGQIGLTELLDTADEALYQAKRAGRNLVGVVHAVGRPSSR